MCRTARERRLFKQLFIGHDRSSDESRCSFRPAKEIIEFLDFCRRALLVIANEVSAAIRDHTDSVRIATPEFPSNWELSSGRASRVACYLVERGVHPNRISVEGYASFRPCRPNSNPRNRSLNRRVEIRLPHDADTAPDPNAADLANDHRS
jgi:flagellar motor protein MotB